VARPKLRGSGGSSGDASSGSAGGLAGAAGEGTTGGGVVAADVLLAGAVAQAVVRSTRHASGRGTAFERVVNGKGNV
jgi:hypothetical protein